MCVSVCLCLCVCGGVHARVCLWEGGTHEYCALSKRKSVSKTKNVSKRENVTFPSVCMCVCMCMCIGMVNSVATVQQSSGMKVGWSSTWCQYVNSIYV